MKAKLIIMLTITAAAFVLNSCEDDPLGLFSDDPRDGLTGEWKVDEDSEIFKKGTDGFYTVTISKENSDTISLYVNNFYELGQNVRVTLDGNKINIPQQTVKGCTINGYGLVSVDFEKIDWSYTVNLDTGDKDNVTATYTRP
jgi:hypothetical protein